MTKRGYIFLFITFFFVLAFSGNAYAVPAAPVSHELTQPDGSVLSAKQWGDEWSHGWETDAGFAIVKDNSATWVYATQDDNGNLVPTSVRADMVPLADLQPSLRPSGASAQMAQALRSQSVQRVVPSTGTANIPVILMNFSDTSFTKTKTNFDDLIFGTDPAVASGPGSMKDYYKEVSNGKFDISAGPSGVVGPFNATGTLSSYGSNSGGAGTDSNVRALILEALAAADATMDFSKYDSDSDGKVDVVAIVHQGTGEEVSSTVGEIWSHRWTLASPVTYDGVTVSDYIIMPELYSGTNISTIGVFAHEYGHAFGLPDLYDTDSTSAGIGNWGLMGGGTWNQTTRGGDTPAHMMAWAKYFLGWTTPKEITKKLTDEAVTAMTTSPDTYICPSNDGGATDWNTGGTGKGEYWIIENRQQAKFDAGLPSTGLLIWHIDETKGDNTDEGGARIVDLVEADGLNHLDSKTNQGDAGDPFKSGGNTSYDKSTTPAAKFYDGTDSTFKVSSVSATGTNMTATLQCGSGLGFTIDDTGSMGGELDDVKNGLTDFITFLKGEIPDPANYPTIVMYTYKDSTTFQIESDDLGAVQAKVDALSASGGGACPEYALSGLYQTALRLGEDTYILFATDASANTSDPISVSQLVTLLTSKGIRVFAFVTGNCSDSSFAPGDPVMAGGSDNNDPFYMADASEAAFGPSLASTLDTFSQITAATGGTLALMPGAKSDTTVGTQMQNMITSVMKSTEIATVTNIYPRDIPVGVTLSVDIDGASTNFNGTPTVSFSGSGITVNSVSVISSTRVRANITISGSAAVTDLLASPAVPMRGITVVSSLGGGVTETATSEEILILSTAPTTKQIISISPSSAVPGDTLDVTVYGINSDFTASPALSFGTTDITVNSVSATSNTELAANISIDAAATIGGLNVTVTTDTGAISESVTGPFFIMSAPAAVSKVSVVAPNSGFTEQTLDLAVTGSDTNFVDGTTTAAFTGGDGKITINSVSVTASTSATVNVSIASDAAPGFRNLTMTTGSESAALIDAFLVLATIPTLGQWGMIILMILTGMVAVYYLTRNEQLSINS